MLPPLRPIRRFCHAAAAASPAAIASRTNTSATCSKQPPKAIPLQESALSKLKAERDPDKLFALFKANAHNKLVIENRFAFEDMVDRLAGARCFDYIEHLLEHQKTLPQGRREGFIVRIIMLYGKAGMVKHAIDTFYDMHLYGFNIVTKAFCEMDSLDSAYLFVVQMAKQGIKPDVITYTTLISTSYKKNRCEIGNGLWNLMVYKGCRPNLTAFNVRIQYLINRRRAWQANDTMRLMLKIGIDPDEVTYNLVIKGFCQTGYLEMAKRVYSSLECRSEYKPNVKIFQTMIHYLCKGGEYNLAYTRCKDCMSKNWFPNVDTIHSLLQGLMKNGQLSKAKMIMTLVRSRIPPFSSTQLDSLQSVLKKPKPG
ncbi:hypothetical protein V6N13_063265 [Hibiscus sabdariffa]